MPSSSIVPYSQRLPTRNFPQYRRSRGRPLTRRESKRFTAKTKRMSFTTADQRTMITGKFYMHHGQPEQAKRLTAITPSPLAAYAALQTAKYAPAIGITYAVLHHRRKKAMTAFSQRYENDPQYRAEVNAKLGEYRRGVSQPPAIVVGSHLNRKGTRQVGGMWMGAYELSRYKKRQARRAARHGGGNRMGNPRHDSRGRFT